MPSSEEGVQAVTAEDLHKGLVGVVVHTVVQRYRAGAHWLWVDAGIILAVHFHRLFGYAEYSNEAEFMHAGISNMTLIFSNLANIVTTGKNVECVSDQFDAEDAIWSNCSPG